MWRICGTFDMTETNIITSINVSEPVLTNNYHRKIKCGLALKISELPRKCTTWKRCYEILVNKLQFPTIPTREDVLNLVKKAIHGSIEYLDFKSIQHKIDNYVSRKRLVSWFKIVRVAAKVNWTGSTGGYQKVKTLLIIHHKKYGFITFYFSHSYDREDNDRSYSVRFKDDKCSVSYGSDSGRDFCSSGVCVRDENGPIAESKSSNARSGYSNDSQKNGNVSKFLLEGIGLNVSGFILMMKLVYGSCPMATGLKSMDKM